MSPCGDEWRSSSESSSPTGAKSGEPPGMGSEVSPVSAPRTMLTAAHPSITHSKLTPEVLLERVLVEERLRHGNSKSIECWEVGVAVSGREGDRYCGDRANKERRQ